VASRVTPELTSLIASQASTPGAAQRIRLTCGGRTLGLRLPRSYRDRRQVQPAVRLPS
jgi:hypothetical protein